MKLPRRPAIERARPLTPAEEIRGIDLYTILLLALLPALGSFLGVALAEWRQPPEWLTGASMHAAAGVGMAVAAIELIPRAQERLETWMLALALVMGSVVAAGLAKATRAVTSRIGKKDRRATTWGAFAAIGIDLLSDGLMTGGGGAVAASLGVLLAVSQVFGNLPGGFAIAANFQSAGVPRKRRFLALAIYPLMPLLGALAGFLVLQDAGALARGAVLGVFAGLLLTATIEDIVPEADQPDVRRRVSSPSFALGFVGLLLMSVYLG